MPAELSYPGVYVEEIPSGVRTIVGVSTSIAAFVGRTPRGPVDRPVTITSFAGYERTFGGDDANVSGGLDLLYPIGFALRDFFLNGGGVAIVCRVFNKTAPGVAEFDAKGIKLLASSPGTWANRIRVRVTKSPAGDELDAIAARLGVAAADLFNLSIRDMRTGGETETFVNLTTKNSARHITGVLASQSNLLRTEETPPTTGPTGVHADVPADKIWSDAATSTPVTSGKEGVISDALAAGTDFGDAAENSGLYLLSKADLFNLLVIPPDEMGTSVPNDLPPIAAKYCRDKRALYIVDSHHEWNTVEKAKAGAEGTTYPNIKIPDARHAALFFPRVLQANPLLGGQLQEFTPSGAIAGVMARTDVTRGVWKAPAGVEASVTGVTALSVLLNDKDNGFLNPIGVNCLRTFPIYGNVVWGSRTMAGADALADDYKYVPVRRLANFIEESLYRGLKWVVFEPNDEPLWAQIRLSAGAFMQDLFRQGAFQGTSARDAYFVVCDKTSTTQSDINKGIVNIVVGFAPLKPAEFVVLQLTQIAGQIQT